ncbi:MAG: cbbY [Rhodospirillaceae bacterium]|nr:MAG: cbbY [Rhodospirillaceae bacterium]
MRGPDGQRRTDGPLPDVGAIIFDVDGTLAETEEVHRRAFNTVFETFGLPWYWDADTYRALLRVGGGRERLRAFLAQTGVAVELGRIDAVHREKSRLYAAWIAQGQVRARPGVLRLLAEARAAGVRLACATSSQRSAVEALLRSLLGPHVATVFAVLGCGEDVPHKKPEPDIYRWVVERLGVEAAACLVIEDSAIGLAAATAAGLPAVVTLSAYSEPLHEGGFAAALAVVSDLGEPQRPFALLAGEDPGHGVVDLPLLRVWRTRHGAG